MKRILIITLILVIGGGLWFAFSEGNFGGTQIAERNLQDLSMGDEEDEGYVYETAVDGPNDCSVYEKYDAESKVCYFECETENQCKQIQSDIDKTFSDWTDELGNDKTDVEEKPIASDDKSLKAEYSVSTGEKITLKQGKGDQKYEAIWSEISELSPDLLSNKYIETYQIFENAGDDTLAFVDDEDQNGKWRVAVNLHGYNTSSERENKATFIHELSHIVSLNLSQVDPNIQETNCKNFYLDEGCTNANSYLNNFQKKFWVNLSKNSDGSAIFSENSFVTEYATTNEVEDLAESFAFFVLGKDGENNGSVKDSKINFFYQYPELVNIRKEMRSVLAKGIVRSRKTQ